MGVRSCFRCSTSHSAPYPWVRKAVENAPKSWNPALAWQTGKGVQAPDSRSAQLWPSQPFWGEVKGGRSFFLFLSLSVNLLFQQNNEKEPLYFSPLFVTLLLSFSHFAHSSYPPALYKASLVPLGDTNIPLVESCPCWKDSWEIRMELNISMGAII